MTNFTYEAGSWTKPRRVVAKVEWHPASSIHASASSSPTCRARPSGSSPSATSAAHASNGSKRARARSNGRGFRAGRLRPTRFGSSFMRWPTISAISCALGDDARTDQGLVADELEGEADQDRREGGEPRTLCRLPDGRSRHPTALFQEILRLIAELRPQPPPPPA